MRKTAFAFVLTFLINGLVHAQGTLIHYWNFNSLSFTTVYTPSVSVISPDFTDLPTAAHAGIVYQPQAGTSAAYYTYIESFASSAADFDTVNLRMSAPAGNYIRVHNPSDSMALLMYAPSTHFQNLKLTFGTSRPTNGMVRQNYDYSTDSGATWTTSGLSLLKDTVTSTFQRITLTCTNDAVNDNAKLVFRIKWSGSITGTAGNNRFDNVSLDGDTIMQAAAVPGHAMASCELFPNPAGNSIGIKVPSAGRKTITVFDLLGRSLLEMTDTRQNIQVSTGSLSPGSYIISITESETGKKTTMRFEKR